MNIWYAASEATPYYKTGGLADVAGSLPRCWARLGHQVTVVLPLYRGLNQAYQTRLELLTELAFELGGVSYSSRVLASPSGQAQLRVLLIDMPWAFDRDSLYGQPDFPDNVVRFAVWGRSLAGLLLSHGVVNVLVGNDWQCGPLLAYARRYCPAVKRVLCIHNLAYQGRTSLTVLPWIELAGHAEFGHYEFYGSFNSLKLGLCEAQLLLTVSPSYAREIQTPEYGSGLEGVLAARAGRLHGILNGLDAKLWNPNLPNIPVPYSRKTGVKKKENLATLRRATQMPSVPGPVFGFVGRLDRQKGVDLLAAAFVRWFQNHSGQLWVLGSGDNGLAAELRRLQHRFPDRVYLGLHFNAQQAEHLYAVCDFLLLPSRYEPCGLGQLIAYRFGTIPIARRTGGLADTIVDLNEGQPDRPGTGLLFNDYSVDALCAALDRALALYADSRLLKKLQRQVMSLEFSWEQSAQAYLRLFES